MRVLSRHFSLGGGEARHFDQRTSDVLMCNCYLLKIRAYNRRINTLFILKLYMKVAVKFYDVFLLCNVSSNVLQPRESGLSMQMRMVLFRDSASKPCLNGFYAAETALNSRCD